ncbi:unnamed protein product [Cylindrotheca closterium]|uniref:Helicase-associated domain-containing protein n=1 Tax=Cylindrotheca closterium TaxID=2856 RepID=A0AAD2JIN3_9STRA|nr:unnamed protein product [Cylindrotheca closterium]
MVFSFKQLERINELVEFQKEHGHCNVPCKTALGNWLSHQKQDYKKWKAGEKSSMSQELVTKLERIGFEWGGIMKTANERAWNLRIQELQAFKKLTGHCNVPMHYSENKVLGRWVSRQRRDYKKWKNKADGKCPMTQERSVELDNLGFVWSAQKALWKTRLLELKDFKEFHGHCNVPIYFPANRTLGLWVQKQRKEYMKRKNKGEDKSLMTQERIIELEKLGFLWVAKNKRPLYPIKSNTVENAMGFPSQPQHLSADEDEDEHPSADEDKGDNDESSPEEPVSVTRQTRRMASRKKGSRKPPPCSTGALGQDEGGHQEDERQEAASRSSKKRKARDATNAKKMAPRESKRRRLPLRRSHDNGTQGASIMSSKSSSVCNDSKDERSPSGGEDLDNDTELEWEAGSEDDETKIDGSSEESTVQGRQTHIGMDSKHTYKDKGTVDVAGNTGNLEGLTREELLNKIAQEWKAKLALRSQLQQSQKERDLLAHMNMELQECNATIRESHRTAMREERDHLRQEIKRRKVAKGEI